MVNIRPNYSVLKMVLFIFTLNLDSSQWSSKNMICSKRRKVEIILKPFAISSAVHKIRPTNSVLGSKLGNLNINCIFSLSLHFNIKGLKYWLRTPYTGFHWYHCIPICLMKRKKYNFEFSNIRNLQHFWSKWTYYLRFSKMVLLFCF